MIVAALLFVLGLVIFVIELRRAPAVSGDVPRSRHGAVSGALVSLLLVAISPSCLLLDDRDLPVERPAEPWRDDGGGCNSEHDDSSFALIVVVGLYLAVRGGLPIVVALGAVSQRRPPPTVPDGRFALRVVMVATSAVGVLATARMAACGARPDEFTTYGGLTPAKAEGWRVDRVLAWKLEERGPIPEGAVLLSELEDHEGSHMPPAHGPYTTALPGLQAWVDGAPVLFHRDAQRVVGSWVRHRDARISPERRPHFAAWPEVARLDADHLVIIGRGVDGGTLAVKVSERDLAAVAVTYVDVGLLVSPAIWPWMIGLILTAIGAALAWQRRGAGTAATRMLAAWLMLEATAVWLYGYASAFGLPA